MQINFIAVLLAALVPMVMGFIWYHQKVFGQTKFIVVSQQFHNERAVFIARKYGIEAYGYNAEDVDAYSGFKTKVRELFARVKVFVDVYTNKKPKFLGEKINIL